MKISSITALFLATGVSGLWTQCWKPNSLNDPDSYGTCYSLDQYGNRLGLHQPCNQFSICGTERNGCKLNARRIDGVLLANCGG
ncbi:hypothetical protein E2P81_ATG09707 [Venturia nashicola]|uniref:Uncharacterized protein n=1 Tax=Venturia nashicola TaxID=86259 RepID=A0A4Z1NNH6_9PEZI|nr:hypothetical protein E6O75_ATG09919 [Venturia nashicola]TLD26050.1 hypothetical protein E2P81_ATG09707 [Venturia nashicola]